MGRHQIEQGSITIAYGKDHVTGYFLSVIDERLSWSSDATTQVNEITEKVNADGGGGYFDLHTGLVGIGHRVDVATILHFWKVYGVKEEHLEMARKGKEF
ncbi:uncharacterized protein STEHIDRAFT_63561 [Stereum hirsutum FP-91666 SS1]|uniref:uncharacterized protein n=1 Tax=Stereum hirsutum (strain FP-91666) TaxID=721885 RepID=UPI00044496C5|nr:uncharacterized protein STEHIDRAFT_63561 [Stereum hirsutum FP-91666 SS1]EIM82655.1 hypothetical protein STEHIDRAFT_63561 [Stereum hirsutum FP-91666 SS1]